MIVAGIKDRETNEVQAQVVKKNDAATLVPFVADNVEPGAEVYTDEHAAYGPLAARYGHESVNHGVSEYVRDQVHTNGVESFWSMMKRGHVGTFHKMSPKHLDRYVTEFTGRHNMRQQDTHDQMGRIVRGMEHKRLRYVDLIADNGLPSGARAA